MPTDIHDPSPTKARNLRIVRRAALAIILLLLPAAIAGVVAWQVWGGDIQRVEVEKIITIEVEKVVTVEKVVEVPVEKIVTVEASAEKIVTRIVVATPTPAPESMPAPCPNDAEREYLTSLGRLWASRDNAGTDYNEVWHLLDDDAAYYLLDPVWQESIRTKAADFRESVYDILTLHGPSSTQGIQNHMIDWTRHQLAGFDLLVRHFDAKSVAELRDSLEQGREATQQHVQSSEASRKLALGEIAELCESPDNALIVFRAAYDAERPTPTDAAASTPSPTTTSRPAATPTSAAESATVSGTGTTAKKVTLPQGTYEVQVEWKNNVTRAFGASTAGVISVQLLNIADFGCSFLVGELAASGQQTHFCEHDGGELRIQVEAQSGAEWTIRFVRD